MAINFFDNIRIGAGKPIDDRYLDGVSPYATIAAANAAIVPSRRHVGLRVLVGASAATAVEYAYQGGVLDTDLVQVNVPVLTLPTGDPYNGNAGSKQGGPDWAMPVTFAPNQGGTFTFIFSSSDVAGGDPTYLNLSVGDELSEYTPDELHAVIAAALNASPDIASKFNITISPEYGQLVIEANAPRANDPYLSYEIFNGTSTGIVAAQTYAPSNGSARLIVGQTHGQMLQVLDTQAWYKWDANTSEWLPELAGGDLTSGPVTSSGGVSTLVPYAIPDASIPVVKITGLGTAATMNTGNTAGTIPVIVAGNTLTLGSEASEAHFDIQTNAGVAGNFLSSEDLAIDAMSLSSSGGRFSSLFGNYHSKFGVDGIDQSFVARIKGAFGWIRGAFDGRIAAADTLTTNRTYTLPDASGTVALLETLGTAATVDAGEFASAAQGAKADTAVQHINLTDYAMPLPLPLPIFSANENPNYTPGYMVVVFNTGYATNEGIPWNGTPLDAVPADASYTQITVWSSDGNESPPDVGEWWMVAKVFDVNGYHISWHVSKYEDFNRVAHAESTDAPPFPEEASFNEPSLTSIARIGSRTGVIGSRHGQLTQRLDDRSWWKWDANHNTWLEELTVSDIPAGLPDSSIPASKIIGLGTTAPLSPDAIFLLPDFGGTHTLATTADLPTSISASGMDDLALRQIIQPGKSAIIHHDTDGLHTEWVCVATDGSASNSGFVAGSNVWIPRTAGIVKNINGVWYRQTLDANGNAEYNILSNQPSIISPP